MNTAARTLARLALVSLGLCLATGCRELTRPEPGSSSLRAGAAEIDITPPVGYRMAGYFDERLATAVHDPLKAKALVLEQGRERVALVFCDLVGVSLHVTTNARAQASRQTGIPVSHIVIGATHSHTGPLFDDVRRDYFHATAVAKFGTDPQEKIYYPAFLTEQLVKVLAAAQANLRPAELAAGITRQEGLTFNRRYWMKNGKVAFNPGLLNPNIVRPAGPTDPEVGMLLLREAETKRPFAGLTVFAMHSDTVGGTEFSADYEYYLQETLRREFGPEYISAFGAGTCGDLNHIDVSRKATLKGFAMSEHLGDTLGQAVLKAVPALPAISRPTLAVRSRTIQAELQKVTPEEVADARSRFDRIADPNEDFMAKVVATKRLDLAGRPPLCPMEVQVFRLDDQTAIVCLPAEIFVELGLAIKQASPFKRTLVISICNDRPSYVPTEKAFREGSYEITNSRVKPGTGEKLVETALALLRESKQ
jgi:neutral ceramidase